MRDSPKNFVSESIRKKIFLEDGYYIFKSFLDFDKAISIRNEVLKNQHCFFKLNKTSNRRLFYYPNSPYSYPIWLIELYELVMKFKINYCTKEKFHLEYCKNIGIHPDDIDSIFNSIKLHTWSSFYMYKDGDSHEKHIDNYGEIAAFLILSELEKDYESGGLYIYDSKDNNIFLDKNYQIGDLIIFDQAKLWHEVKKVTTVNKQIGRLQYYVPTIPYGYMNDVLLFEDYEKVPYFSRIMTTSKKAKILKNLNDKKSKDIHYSRKNYFKNWNHFSK